MTEFDDDHELTPGELRQKAEEARERAELAEEAADLASDAITALSALTDHEGVSEGKQHQFELLYRMVSSMRHAERWGYDSFHLQNHADTLERRAERMEEAKDDE